MTGGRTVNPRPAVNSPLAPAARLTMVERLATRTMRSAFFQKMG
jgi:hypothetical protein